MRIKCDRTGTTISFNIDAPTSINLEESGAIEEAVGDATVANRSVGGDIGCCMRRKLDVGTDGCTGEVRFVEYAKCPHRNTRYPTREREGADHSSIDGLVL